MSVRKSDAFDFAGVDELGGFRGDLDPEFLVRLQTNRCALAQSSGDEATFAGSVMALLGLIPSEKREEINSEKTDYTKTIQEYEYVTIGGWKLGTPEAPVYRNRRGTLEYNPHLTQTKTVTVTRKDETTGEEYEAEEETTTYGEPVLISPRLVQKEETDYYALFIKIQQKLQEAGLSWHMQRLEAFTGEVWDPSMETEEDAETTGTEAKPDGDAED